MAIYKLVSDLDQPGVEQVVVKNTSNGYATYIPFDDKNQDYVEYKAWVAAGNTPDASDS
tara:strand:- start:451 stop:627 length:177 start_codon:yes stop_codon:yes gene_type:complete